MENYNDIFATYYTLYRGEATTPDSSDDEYTIGMRFANEAINRWANYEGTYWKELFATLQGADDGDKVIVSGQTEYDAPSDMREAGGFVKILNSDGLSIRNIPIIDPEEAQFRGERNSYAYFTGNPTTGYTLNLNPEPETSIVGSDINYIYYKKPTLFESGTDETEVPDLMFIVNRMLAQRYRVSRNPFYNSALRDAEDCLKTMQLDNNSGTFANPWSVPDRSGTIWGNGNGSGWSW